MKCSWEAERSFSSEARHARVGDVPPLELDGFRMPQPAHEEQPDDDAVDGPALGRELRGLPTSADGRPARRWPPGFAAEQGAA